jgi:hypothetical protein
MKTESVTVILTGSEKSRRQSAFHENVRLLIVEGGNLICETVEGLVDSKFRSSKVYQFILACLDLAKSLISLI